MAAPWCRSFLLLLGIAYNLYDGTKDQVTLTGWLLLLISSYQCRSSWMKNRKKLVFQNYPHFLRWRHVSLTVDDNNNYCYSSLSYKSKVSTIMINHFIFSSGYGVLLSLWYSPCRTAGFLNMTKNNNLSWNFFSNAVFF